MKILITGANGQLSKSFIEINSRHELVLATKKKLDITSKKDILRLVKDIKPDIIFHFASLTRGDECTKDPKLAHKVNVVGTKNIVAAAKKNNCSLLFISTNEIFDGRKNKPYKENDRPNPQTVVGKTKYEAEKIIKKNLRKYYIIRTSWLYSKWSNNFINIVLDIAKKKKRIELVEDEVSSPTYSKDLAIAIDKLILTRKYGIYHINNSKMASRLEFAKKAFEIYGLRSVKIMPVKLKDYKRLSKPPLFTPLDNSKIKKLGISLSHWENALEKYLSN